jgi:hypothetical protein
MVLDSLEIGLEDAETEPGAGVAVNLPGNGHLPSIGARFQDLECPLLAG